MNEVKFKANLKDMAALQAAVSEIPEIPTPETTDEGKVITVAVDSSGETPVVSYELDTPSEGLPAISAGDAGKVLTVNAGETGAEWATPSGGGGFTIISVSSATGALNKTAAELIAMLEGGVMPLIEPSDNETGVEWTYSDFLNQYVYDDRGGSYQFSTMVHSKTYTAATINDYPVDDSF